jgi:geranylgeranyl diphosphate synthase type I
MAGVREPRDAGRFVADVEWLLADFLAGEVVRLAAVDPALGEFARVARDCVLAGGKRLRPTFAYWGWRGLAGPDAPVTPLLPALAALEVLHAFALIHDDVMDESETRRGRPTAHRTLAARHAAAGHRGDSARFGRSAAVLAGDLCLIWADRLLAAATLPPAVLLAARRRYDEMRVEAVAGQYLDVLGEADPGGWSVTRAMRVARYKTASYTVLRPLQFGAALAGAAPDRQAAADAVYERYGVAVGEAFQLRDDLLGVYGDPALTGKPVADDLRSGKPTTLLMIARQRAGRARRAEFEAALAALTASADGDPGHDGRHGAGLGLDNASHDGASSDGSSHDGASHDGSSHDGASHDGSSHDGASRDGASGGDGPGPAVRLRELISETDAVQQVEQMIEQRLAEGLSALTEPIQAPARHALRRLALRAAHRRA